MTLCSLLKQARIRFQQEFKDFELKGLTSDSRRVKQDFVFVAVRGSCFDGHSFIPEAIKLGARAIIVDEATSAKLVAPQSKRLTFIKVKDTKKVLGDLVEAFYGYPAKSLKLIGITGTNGKTTVAYLIEAILKKAGFQPGLIGTINYHFKDKEFFAKNTTPGREDLEILFSKMKSNKIDYVIMEISSHALSQKRTEGLNFCAGIFTNLGSDHLDYHKNKEDYFLAKAKLFSELRSEAYAVLNEDDTYSGRIKKLTKARIITYGLRKNADLKIGRFSFGADGSRFTLSFKGKSEKFKSQLLGEHNLYNIAAAAAFALSRNLKLGIVKRAIEEFSGVRGRLERIDSKEGFSVFVDYAHTEEALRNAITSLKPLSKGRLIVVFGCGGERDKTKRARMGRCACRLCDYVIITSDNPRQEDPREIIKDILSGVDLKRYQVHVDLDRYAAIKEALNLAQIGDIILIAGKGHETEQRIKDKVIPFNDAQVIQECLALRK
ncbi:MAG: UDP-N-acetylmuramoyl-L-alanyl-D-glutamate--2,6-diaminopimelate ligase [Candidatus Omnitrophica bacterium]|nr:UDP-N-acetylmuramoyl-L-alanyl-D-glutamate--2,6-diaminopimelate ligase [Candidatus Omnitrophota bacterium]